MTVSLTKDLPGDLDRLNEARENIRRALETLRGSSDAWLLLSMAEITPLVPAEIIRQWGAIGRDNLPRLLTVSDAALRILQCAEHLSRLVGHREVKPGMWVRPVWPTWKSAFRQVDAIEDIGDRVIIGYADDAVECGRYRLNQQFEVRA